MGEIEVPTDFISRHYQLPFLEAMGSGIRRAVLVWHRRAGKDTSSLAFTFSQMFQRVGIYYYIFPTYNQAKKVIWDGKNKQGRPMLDMLSKELRCGENSVEMKISVKNGSIFQLVGSDNYDSLMGTNPVGCVFSEYALQNPMAYQFFKPILRENGGWAIFPYTPRGHNHGHVLYEMAKQNPEWFSQILTVEDTGIFSAADIEAERREGMSADLIQQEYYCSFSGAIPGAYYAKLLDVAGQEGRICNVPWEPKLTVETFWDLGVRDSTAIWFVQQHHQEVRVIDYYEASGVGLTHYIKMLSEKPYVYKKHHAPFDIEVRELGTGKSRLETAKSLGIKFEIVPRLGIEDGIEAARNLLPRCWFDITKCQPGLQALRNYHSEYDETKRVLKRSPVHDWSADGSDAFRYLAVGLKKPSESMLALNLKNVQNPWLNRHARGSNRRNFRPL